MSDVAATDDVPAAITTRLAQGEKLVWWDRPIPSLLAQREFSSGFLFGLFFLAFSLFWIWGASKSGAFALFGVRFVAVGVWMVSSPLRAYVTAPNTLYGLSDRRALVVTRNGVRSFPLEQIKFVEVDSFADGSGHVYFFEEPASFGPWSSSSAGAVQKAGFLAVAEAERISSALLDSMQKRTLGPETSEQGARR